MRQLLVLVICWLVLGVLTSLAVAWVGAFHAQYQLHTNPTRTFHNGYDRMAYVDAAENHIGRWYDDACASVFYVLPVPEVFGERRNPWKDQMDTQPLAVPGWSAYPYSDDQWFTVREFAAGWPLRAWSARVEWSGRTYCEPWNQELAGGVQGLLPWKQYPQDVVMFPYYLPIQPIAGGLLVNSVMGAVIWAGPFLLASMNCRMRRRHARKKARCDRCGYSLAQSQSTRCPECGTDQQRPWAWFGRRSTMVAQCMAVLGALVMVGFGISFNLSEPTFPLHYAAAMGDAQAVRAYLDAHPETDVNTALGLQVSYDTVTKQSGFNVALGYTPLVLAASSGNVSTVTVLLDAGANSGSGHRSAMACSISNDDIEVLRYLLDRLGPDTKASPDGEYSLALFLAVSLWNDEAMNALVEHGAIIGPYTLSRAVRSERLEAARYLLEHGAPITNSTITAVCNTETFNPALTALLDEYDADWAATDANGENALLYGRRDPSFLLVWQRIVDAGADVNVTGPSGGTPLHMYWEVSPEFVALMLEHGAEVNAADQAGDTPLCVYASKDGDAFKAVVTMLLEAGADPLVTCSDGKRPIDHEWVRAIYLDLYGKLPVGYDPSDAEGS